MAATAQKQRAKRRRGQSHNTKEKTNSRFLTIGVAVLVVALLAIGTFQIFNGQTATNTSTLQVDGSSLESVEIEGNQQTVANSSVADAPVAIVDRETRYLGAPSDPATLSLAEAGQLGQPVLLWFHADW